jgi:hypothetical protein
MTAVQNDYVKCCVNINILPLSVSHTQRDVLNEGKYHFVIHLVMAE